MTAPGGIGGAHQVALTGAFKVIPGFAAGTYKGDQLPFFINSPVMAWATTAVVQQGTFMVPFNAKIVGLLANVVAAPTTADGSIFEVGTRADPDHFLAGYAFASTVSTGLVDLSSATELVNTSIDAGDVIEFSLGIETAVGSIAATLVCVPRSS
jgi:hypothetical protein